MHNTQHSASLSLHSCLDRSNLLAFLLARGGHVEVLGARNLGGRSGQEDLNVAWVALVRVAARQCQLVPLVTTEEASSHSTVCAVSPPPRLGRLLDDNVFDDEILDGEILGIRVGLRILQQTKDELDGFGWPAA